MSVKAAARRVELLSELRLRTPAMVGALRALVEAESPTADIAACAACAVVADDLALRTLGVRGERHVVDGRTHLRWRFGRKTRVLLLGHVDTVWPLGTLARWPFELRDDLATGPGVFDMKAGVVQLLFAVAAVESRNGLAVLLTSDEETGSPTSRALIEETVAGAEAALALEPSAGGALKTERKGVTHYCLEVFGRAAHAGLDPEKGANAAVELAHQLVTISALQRPALGTTVTPSVVNAGTAVNTVPARASARIDVRTKTVAEAERIDRALSALTPVLLGTSLAVERIYAVPPLERRASADLYDRAERLARDLGLPQLREASVGGGSDGNLTASLGVPTLDGLGAVGDHAHGEGEFVSVGAMAERAALVAALVMDILDQGVVPRDDSRPSV